MTVALSHSLPNGLIPNRSIRSWHWMLALLVAVALHLFVYLGLVSGVTTAPVLRGGGSFGASGDQAAPAGLRVGLAPPERSAPVEPQPADPQPTPAEAAPTPATPAQAASTPIDAPPAPVAPETPAPQTTPIEETQVEEVPTEVTQAKESPEEKEAPREQARALPEPVTAEPAREKKTPVETLPPQEIAETRTAPPVPSRKPAPPPLPKPELGLLEERLPLQGPDSTPESTSQTAGTPSLSGDTAGGTISELRHVEGEGAVGTASLNSDGLVPKLNYKDQVLLWVKRHGSYPRDSHRFKHEGTVLLHFVIGRSGEILYYNIRKSSGYYLLDQAVRKMMDRASPVPPIPSQITQDEIEFTVPVQFIRS